MSKSIFIFIFFLFPVLFSTPSLSEESIPEDENIEVCQSCHGQEMLADDPLVPNISGQHFFYIYTQLKDYKSNRRAHEIMTLMASGLEKDIMKKISTYYSEKKWTGFRAKNTYDISLAESTISAGQCSQCHGDWTGASGVPRLAGQKESYLKETMNAFKTSTRLNSASKNSLFKTISDEAINALSGYLADQ